MPERSRPATPAWVKVFAAIAAVIVLIVVLMLTGVLGEGHGPGRHLGRTGPASMGAPADPSEATRTIDVSALDTLAFEPASARVTAGEVVTFRVTNSGSAVHEFTLGDAAMQQEHAEMMAHMPDGMGHGTSNSITLQPGATDEIAWRFGDAGTVEYACHRPGHYQGGMRGTITVS